VKQHIPKDPLLWWNSFCADHILSLKYVATPALSMMPSAASVEGTNSLMKHVQNLSRVSMNNETATKLLYIYKHTRSQERAKKIQNKEIKFDYSLPVYTATNNIPVQIADDVVEIEPTNVDVVQRVFEDGVDNISDCE
jgi:hypothetical protein